jgi:hypothetical protein
MDGGLGQLERERAIARLATAQHGVISALQLGALGVSRDSVDARRKRARLHLVHREVYAVGHRVLTSRGWAMAAVLACGPEAVLSHRSAAALLGLRPTSQPLHEVTSPRRASSRDRIRVYRVRALAAADVATVDGIPVTAVARTLLDLGGVVDLRQLERACDRAEALELFDLAAVHDVLARHPFRRGSRALRLVLATHAIGNTLTESELEERFLHFCARRRLPRPECSVALALPHGEKTTVDILWRRQRLVVEMDGWATHRTRLAFEHDRERDARLAVAGYRCVRLTWRRLHADPAAVASQLRALLGA